VKSQVEEGAALGLGGDDPLEPPPRGRVGAKAEDVEAVLDAAAG
jgi:hypothetical protein